MLGGFDGGTGGYDDASGAGSGGAAAAKRGRDLEQLGRDAKRLKKEECVSSAVEWLTPAATPAYAGVAETVSSPYSETEEYMFRGYYEDELVENNRACSVPCEMTPALGDASEGNYDNDQAAWSGTPAATVYEDSYDIEM